MLCPTCGHDNREGRRFCSECGSPLGARCPHCQALNQPGERFCGECGRPLAQPTTTPQPPAPVAPTVALPTSFASGRYQVKRFLGEGGKKRVYLAHDTLLDRDVAFALIKADGLDESGRARVLREAQAMGRLGSHPHIVTVFDLGQEPPSRPSPTRGEGGDGGQPYMVSELMGGGDVEGLIEKAADHKLPLEQALRIAIETCQGLEFAHGHGIIHRDLKPGNVWLTQPGVAKIGDFGLAVATDRSRLTQVGMMVGTVAYMPPEQATGGQVTARSDLYSLGCMVYEMVAGRPPFVGDNPVAIISQHLNSPPVAPTWHRPDCPAALEALVLRLLAKDPTQRPASAAEVRSTLEHIDLSAKPVGAGLQPAQPSANPLDRLARGVFVNRAQELAQGRALVDEALSGHVGMLLLTGDIGIGKTRLAEEIGTYASLRGAQVLTGASYPDQGAPPYWPWVQALRAYVRTREPALLRSELGSSGPEVAKMVSDLRERLPDLPPPTPGDPAQERFRLFDAVATFLRNASAAQPIVVILDNLHAADPPTLLLAQFLLQEAGQARLLLIGTYREVEAGRQNPVAQALADLAQQRRFHRLPLRGLSLQDTRAMVDALTGKVPPEALVERIHQATDGVPLYIEEMVRLLAEEGRLEAASPVALPQSVREVIGRRLDRLPEETIQALTIGAVVGRDFDFALVKELTPDLTEDRLLDLMEAALKTRLIEEVEGSVGRYRFAHGVTRLTLLGDLSTTRRVRLHGRIAEALERVYGRDAPRHAPELAYHFLQASSLSNAQEKAVRYAVFAAQAADAASAFEEALRHYEAALGLMQDTGQAFGQDEVALRRGLGNAQRHGFRMGEAFRTFRRAMRLAHERGDRQSEAELALEQARTGAIPPGLRVAVLTQGLQVVPDAESELAALMHAMFSTGQGLTPAQQAELDIAGHRKQAEELASKYAYADVKWAIAAADLLGAVNRLDVDQWLALEQALEQLETDSGRTVQAADSVPRIHASALRGDPDGAIRQAERIRTVARRNRDQYAVIRTCGHLAQLHVSRGEFAKAQEALEVGRLWEGRDPEAIYEGAHATLAEALGDLHEAQNRMASALAIMRRLRLPGAPAYGSSLASFERRMGNLDSANDLYQEAVRYLNEAPNALVRLSMASRVALEAAARGDTSVMAECRQVLTPFAERLPIGSWSPWFITVDRALGAMAVAEGLWEEAIGYLEKAVAFCQEKGLVVELAHCRLALADAYKGRNASGDRQKAGALADQALADYRRLKMPLYIQDALARREILRA